ncbi:MAG: hypothetical protein LBG46_00555 [Elusimicrobiota bacterium]|jgi:hypothetical protein|nr:hypothetical protein [Elusimicrobiota bacterium]
MKINFIPTIANIRNACAAWALFAVLLPSAYAQSIEVISYVPLKQAGTGASSGSSYGYDFISVKSLASLANNSGSGVTTDSLKANSATLTIDAKKITFGTAETTKNILVRNNFFAGQGTNISANNLYIGSGSEAFLWPDMAQSINVSGAPKIKARDIALKQGTNPATLKLDAGQTIKINNMILQHPPSACSTSGVGWKTVTASATFNGSTASYKVFGCLP